MDYRRIGTSQIDQLWELQLAYKAEIEEDAPNVQDKNKLLSAIERGQIVFSELLTEWY